MKHIFITDPIDNLIVGHDSTLALMREAKNLGHEVYNYEPHQVQYLDNAIYCGDISLDTIAEDIQTYIWIRQDPPVNYEYIQLCQILRLIKNPNITVLNNPESLLICNEKLFALQFPEFTPTSYVTCDLPVIHNKLEEHKQLILKPIDGFGGSGIFLLSHGMSNLNSILELATQNYTQKVILQEYLPEAKTGDKRVFLCKGNPVGAVLRIPGQKDHRANLARGGDYAQTNITEQEYKCIEFIKPYLLDLGLYIVGLDFIGNKLTEINITSPTCLEEIAEVNTNPAHQIIQQISNTRD